MPKKEAVLVATESGCTVIKGTEYNFVKGTTHVSADHPLARAVPQFFAPAEERLSHEIEQATAAPGEKRK